MDPLPLVISELERLRVFNVERGEEYRARAFERALALLRRPGVVLRSGTDVDALRGIGVRIKDRIKEILRTGLPLGPEVPESLDPAIAELTRIHGIGKVKATSLVARGIRTIEDLQGHPELLNHTQRMGLRYFPYAELRIPRIEMGAHESFLRESFPSSAVAGSYRRGMPDSGDIDLIVNADKIDPATILEDLKRQGYIMDELASGESKWMGYVHIALLYGDETEAEIQPPRRLDILFTSGERYPFALLYFTGSGPFNIRMRSRAQEMGYLLNEYELVALDGKPVPVMREERDIFAFLGMEYVEPEERV